MSHWQRCLPALALGTLVLTGCSTSTHLAEGQIATQPGVVTQTPVETPTPTVTEPVETTPTSKPPHTGPTGTGPTHVKPPQTTPPPTNRPPAPLGTSSSPLNLGTFHQVGKDFRVSVTAVDLFANQAIEAANEFNSPAHGRYVLAEMNVVYLGNEEGDPWIDLRTKFLGADARQYDSSQCGAVVAHPGIFVPTLEHGGRARYQVCWDVPPAAIARGKIFVEQTFLFDSPRIYWKIR